MSVPYRDRIAVFSKVVSRMQSEQKEILLGKLKALRKVADVVEIYEHGNNPKNVPAHPQEIAEEPEKYQQWQEKESQISHSFRKDMQKMQGDIADLLRAEDPSKEKAFVKGMSQAWKDQAAGQNEAVQAFLDTIESPEEPSAGPAP